MKRSNWSTRSWSFARPTAIGPRPGGVGTSKRSSRLHAATSGAPTTWPKGSSNRAHNGESDWVNAGPGRCVGWPLSGTVISRRPISRRARSVHPAILEPHNPHAVRVLLDLVEAAVRSGRDAEAAAHVAAMRETNVASLSSHLALVVGGSAAMAAPDDTTLELFHLALALPGIGRWQFDLARVQLAYGERLRRRQRMAEARGQLNAALEIFQRLRARPWVDRTTVELRATGQTKPRAGDSVLDRLTPQELEIVRLAASGLTNRQIAERLFLSPRTVGGHLHRAFPKLGVATRAALRDALAAIAPEQFPRA